MRVAMSVIVRVRQETRGTVPDTPSANFTWDGCAELSPLRPNTQTPIASEIDLVQLASRLAAVEASARITPDTSAHTPFKDGPQLGSKLASGTIGQAGEKAPNGEKNLF